MLADPPLKLERYNYYQPTMGIMYLLGSLRRAFAPSELDVRYLQGFGSLADHLKAIDEFTPDIYGISFKTPMARLGYRTITAVKERFPDLPVIAGGAHATLLHEEMMRVTPVDACFRGECENTIVDLVRRERSGLPRFEELPGVVFRDRGKIARTPEAPFTKNIDEFAWPAWDMIELDSFPGMPYRRSSPYMGVVVSRGCPYECIFCSEPIWKISGSPTYRARAPENVVKEAEYLYERGVRELRLWCEELNTSAEWAIQLMDAFASMGHKDLFLNFNMRANNVNDRMAAAMAKANTWLVCIGMESSSDRTLAGLRKRTTTRQIEEACEVLSKHGIRVLGYFQFYSAWEEGGELRWETPRDCRDTIRWALDLSRRGRLHYISTALATPRPGTPLWDLAVARDILKIPADEPFSYLGEGMRLPGISSAQMRATVVQANLAKVRIAVRSGGINAATIPSFLAGSAKRLAKT